MTPEQAAAQLRMARRTGVPRVPFTDADRGLDEQWGYAVQDLDKAHRLAAGERVVGAKLGLTSRAKQRTMGVHQPIAGFLTDAMLAPAGIVGSTRQPRIEPEIAFRLGRVLDRPLTLDTATEAVDAVAVAAEIIDSRYAGYVFRLPDVVADNTSAAGFAVGEWMPVPTGDALAEAACVFSVDAAVARTTTGAAVLGHPMRALVHLSEHLARRGQSLAAGAIVLAGALTDAVPLRAGVAYHVRIDGLGELRYVTAG